MSSTSSETTPLISCNQSRLEHLREIARERAQIKHAEIKALRKPTPPRTYKKPLKQLTKRQLSSKRSAEICRIKSNIYTELLERAVADEEYTQQSLYKRFTEQIKENTTISNRIAQLEEYSLKHGSLPQLTCIKLEQRLFSPTSITTADNSLDGIGEHKTFGKNCVKVFGDGHKGEVRIFNPGFSGDFHFDEISIDVQSHKRYDDSKFISDLMLTEPVDSSLSPVTQVSSEPAFSSHPKFSEPLFSIR